MALIVGHRGCAYAIENTIASFRAAKEHGAAGVEFDVRLTADGIPVIFHDETLKRLCGQKYAVADLPLCKLPDVDGEEIPTLFEAAEEIMAMGLAAFVEIKAERNKAQAGAEVAKALMDLRMPAVVSSFSMEILDGFYSVAPGYEFALATYGQWPRLGGLSQIHHSAGSLTPEIVGQIRAAGMKAGAWVVNEPLGFDVDILMTDYPDRFK